MKFTNLCHSLPALILSLFFLPHLAFAELRCGWVDNPTPANWWLTDRDGEWLLSVQGVGDRNNGFLEVTDGWEFQNEWVETNGTYGYGCGCFEGEVDETTNWVLRVTDLSSQTLAICKSDSALPKR